MAVCVAGCVVRGEHGPDCPGTTDDGLACPGCLPRGAVAGLVLCASCWSRLQRVVRTLPSVVEHLVAAAVPSLASPSGSAGGVRRPPGPGCLWPDALDAADDLHAGLWAWCAEVAAECPWASSPPVSGSRWSADGQDVVGLAHPSGTRGLVRWLDPHLEWVGAQSWAGVMVDELGAASARASARWPVEEPERRVTEVRCPSCGALSLVVRPVRVVGGESQVVCSRLACGRVLSEQEWERARGGLSRWPGPLPVPPWLSRPPRLGHPLLRAPPRLGSPCFRYPPR
ncbi:hypothetical protein D5R93_05790 [Actinomyces lilanjuaniae]|uniref:Uncharacterized protein n=1 Tax=Actinomyces lilanjuaniae TaxID=2321394 RepID=A0ABM6Z303_9ACTO|nr:hypothetical protein [Actinomyces lilanjuaniae]AYD89683.1 hypothetical protein D5R93_05790 [Actinomyces lilanjuaniae]